MALEDGSSMAVALKDGGGMAALGGGIGRQLKIVVALGGGGGRRTCNNASASALSKPGVIITTSASALVRMAREDTADTRALHWQQW